MAVIFSDNFNRSDSSNLGSDWTENSGDAQIVSNVAQNSDTNTTIGTATSAGATPSNADYDVQAECSADGLQTCGIVGRFTDTTHFYTARITPGTGVTLYKFNGGASLIGSSGQSISSSTFYTLKLKMSGTSLKVDFEGSEVISTTDSDLSSTGYGGFRLNPDTGVDCYVDDFQIEEDIAAAEQPRLLTILGVGA